MTPGAGTNQTFWQRTQRTVRPPGPMAVGVSW